MFIICLLGAYVYFLVFFSFNSQVFNVSNYILLNIQFECYMMFMKKIINHVVQYEDF
jgi:hypothetical protein